MEEKKQDISTTNQQILDTLKDKWKTEFAQKKEEWLKKPGGWMSKYVSTSFKLNGVKYSIYPEDIGLTHSGWDQAFMETVQPDIEKDLESYGATEIRSFGDLD